MISIMNYSDLKKVEYSTVSRLSTLDVVLETISEFMHPAIEYSMNSEYHMVCQTLRIMETWVYGTLRGNENQPFPGGKVVRQLAKAFENDNPIGKLHAVKSIYNTLEAEYEVLATRLDRIREAIQALEESEKRRAYQDPVESSYRNLFAS